METIKELQEKLQKSIKEMDLLMKDNPNGWVIESKDLVYVGEEYGLNNTGFNTKILANPVIWDNKEDAFKYGFNPYLIDGYGKPIYQNVAKTGDFFPRQIKITKQILKVIEQALGKTEDFNQNKDKGELNNAI